MIFSPNIHLTLRLIFVLRNLANRVPSVSEEDAIKAKRLQNTLAARRSRKRKLEYQRELEDAIEAGREEKERWLARALILEAILRDSGREVPLMGEA